MSSIYFSPEILHSHERVKAFLKGDEAKERILNSPRSYESLGSRLEKRPWELFALEVAAMGFMFIASGVLTFAALGLHALHASDLAKRCEVLHDNLSFTKDITSVFCSFRSKYLCHAKNCHRLDTGDVYLSPPVRRRSVKDPVVQGAMFSDEVLLETRFYNRAGICRGMVGWFSYLYLSTKMHFKEVKAHVAAVSREFEEGAPREASLIQSFYKAEQIFLRMNKTVYTCPFNRLGSQHIRDLKNGVYSFGLPEHVIGYIKVSPTESYLFDPNAGTLELDAQESYSIIAKYCQKSNSHLPIYISSFEL